MSAIWLRFATKVLGELLAVGVLVSFAEFRRENRYSHHVSSLCISTELLSRSAS
ncbi:hypothetical protein DOTSEDRAFT_68910 [Dothistroma septosporum NZE10]|uniref:Uncharacterized protein n=1 Tax=Dothistroma septosporum (strain NZE10 / CBS 128990) TaxID=675120 RepID=N1Q3E1_DOTSN|nr:hypothetical protein DOTSEDRAFT_68910 [Dothistroma septosporum NZE10]